MSFAGKPQSIKAAVDLTGRGEADYVVTLVANLSSMPNGIAWNGGSLFIASLDPYKSCTLYRLDNVDTFALGKKAASLADLAVVRDDLPFDFWHGWKFIRFGPDGNLYVPIGADCNACRLDGSPPNNGTVDGELVYSVANSGNTSHVTAPYTKGPGSPVWQFGSIYRMARDGSSIAQVASGVRNTVGFDWHPDTGKLYFTDNGRDNWDLTDPNVTDNRPDCELNVATEEGSHFGFPFCHTGPAGGDVNFRPYLRLPGVGPQLVDPDLNANETAMTCNGPALSFKPAIQAMGPHTAPLGMRFYRWSPGANFPQAYDRSILLAQHGSWNRQRPIGARVMRVTLDSTDPTRIANFTPFLSGGVPGDKGAITGPDPPIQPNTAYNGRPVDVEQLPDGSLLVSDDAPSTGAVYRVSYHEPVTCRSTTAAAGRKLQEDEHEDDDGMNMTLYPSTIPGTANGCAVNLGSSGVQRYRRCVRSEVPAGSGRFVQLATSFVTVGSQRILRGALVLPDFACLDSANGWVGFGLPAEQGGGDMTGARVFITRPAPGTPTGASATDYKLAGTSVAYFQPTSGFLLPGSLKAYQSGHALVTTFDIILPAPFQPRSPPSPRPRPRPPPRRGTRKLLQAAPSTLSFLFAMGDVNAVGAMMRHWVTARVFIPYTAADLDATVDPDTPVLNRGAGPKGLPPASPPPPAGAVSPPPPPAPPLPTCQPSEPCCLNGVKYDACQTTTNAGFSYSQFYAVSGGALRVGIKAITAGWIAWAFNGGNQGHMLGADAFFARPCASGCPTGASTVAFNLATYSINTFTAPADISFTPTGSGSASGTLSASFTLPWPSATNTIKINYGGGPYSGGSPTGADGMGVHSVFPPTACVSNAGGTASMPAAC
ncbi:hypothetical protein ABPG77_010553 [Micractinium sp. CCAP 211/92]